MITRSAGRPRTSVRDASPIPKIGPTSETKLMIRRKTSFILGMKKASRLGKMSSKMPLLDTDNDPALSTIEVDIPNTASPSSPMQEFHTPISSFEDDTKTEVIPSRRVQPNTTTQSSRLIEFDGEILTRLFRHLTYDTAICLALSSKRLYRVFFDIHGQRLQGEWLYSTYHYRAPKVPLHKLLERFMGPDYDFCHRHLKFLQKDQWEECGMDRGYYNHSHWVPDVERCLLLSQL